MQHSITIRINNSITRSWKERQVKTMNDYLCVKEVAEMLSVSMQTVYKLVKSGELRSVRVGKRGIRIPRTALDDFVCKRQH